MSNITFGMSESLIRYIHDVTVNEDTVLSALRAETADLEMHRMQISAEQGQFMSLLVKLINAKRIIEVGVFTGYSAICMAKSLPENGQIIACDTSEEWTSIAKRYWKQAGVSNKIDLKLAPAADTLNDLQTSGQNEQFDLVFIDADKENYMHYYEQCLSLLRSGGLLLVDNTLWSGQVADDSVNDVATEAIRELNQHIANDARVMSSLLTISDGVTMVYKY